MRRSLVTAWLLAALAVSACGDPPNKEMDQALGAIAAARAAGAERYATAEYTAATTALEQSEDAVAQRDYRLALNQALESREQAENAARVAADTRARIRGEVERTMAEVAGLLALANTRIDAAREARVPARALRDAQRTLAQVNTDVQKAGAAMKKDDHVGAQPALTGVKERIEKAIEAVDAAITAQTPRRRR